jgi:predicted DNA-binding WGR domain protein
MANVSEGDSPALHIVLERVDPARNIARYYVLSIEPTLFAKHTLIRRWGRIGCLGRESLQFFGIEDASRAQVTLETWLARKRKRGYQPPVIDAPPATVITPIEQAEALVRATGASINHGGGRAFYRSSTDSIQLPPREAFIGSPTSSPAEAYYSTIFHELTHWTSEPTRCNRELGKRFGDNAYAIEELVAELGAAFLCAELGITDEPRADHAQYLATWLSVLKADKKAIFTAASKASEAAAFLAAFQVA